MNPLERKDFDELVQEINENYNDFKNKLETTGTLKHTLKEIYKTLKKGIFFPTQSSQNIKEETSQWLSETISLTPKQIDILHMASDVCRAYQDIRNHIIDASSETEESQTTQTLQELENAFQTIYQEYKKTFSREEKKNV